MVAKVENPTDTEFLQLTPLTAAGLPLSEDGTCGSLGCVCGWSIALSNEEDVLAISNGVEGWEWTHFGQILLGFDRGLAYSLFILTNSGPRNFPETLRRLAKYPEPRTLDNFNQIQDDLANERILEVDVPKDETKGEDE